MEGIMAEKFKEEMKKSLLALKRELLNNLASKNDSFQSLISSSGSRDEADIASDEIDRKMLESMSSQDLRKLRLIDAALSRIEAKRFGLCMRCGKKISEARLRALPYATLCISCKNNDEKLNR